MQVYSEFNSGPNRSVNCGLYKAHANIDFIKKTADISNNRYME